VEPIGSGVKYVEFEIRFKRCGENMESYREACRKWGGGHKMRQVKI